MLGRFGRVPTRGSRPKQSDPCVPREGGLFPADKLPIAQRTRGRVLVETD